MSSSKKTSERLQKHIAASGLMSRRAAEAAMAEGRVSLSGEVVREPGTKGLYEDITVDGKPLPIVEGRIVLLLNKPSQVMSTRSDPEGRRTVMDLVPSQYKTLKPVGRLDYDSEGLMILTNDGELALQLTHPRYGVEKVYEAQVEETPGEATLAKLCEGVRLKDGVGKFVEIKVIKKSPSRTWLRVVVNEGRNRFVRRMLAAMGHAVLQLKRVQMGPYKLPRGKFQVVD